MPVLGSGAGGGAGEARESSLGDAEGGGPSVRNLAHGQRSRFRYSMPEAGKSAQREEDLSDCDHVACTDTTEQSP